MFFFNIGGALTHWGRVTHICVGNLATIGSNNGLSPGRRQTIILIKVGILFNWSRSTYIYTFLFKKNAFEDVGAVRKIVAI